MQVDQNPRTPQTEQLNSGGITRKFVSIIFYLQLLGVSALAVILTIRGFLSHHAHLHFHPLDWYPPMLTAVGLAGIMGLVFQALSHSNPTRAIKLAFWFGPLITCSMGVLLISIGSSLGLGFGVLATLVGVVQALYACWVNPRFDHAISVLAVSAGFPPAKTAQLAVLALGFSIGYCAILMGGVGGATAAGTHVDGILVGVMVLSMVWTMQVVRNVVLVGVSWVKYLNFSCGDDWDLCRAFRNTLARSMGPVCLGSVLVPTVSLVRGSARAVSLVAGDSDEFLFSCADCYSGLASKLVTCANRWGFVHIGVYRKGIVQSSRDTWEMFRRAGMEELIDYDLTSSFCLFCGVAGGGLSSLVGGSWSLVVHKEYATQISLFGFLIGYFITRVALAGPQAGVSAYHVAYAENSESARFDATIPVRLQELHRQRKS
ncbi:hypothetical protein Cgig2_021956 [Carnegiea gigantea]|uniref:Choline transporter-like protein n=1 Tax=Carnegiea gigantea TaxID=171969 RepID=A0A9Q1KRP7_9CARY|nr:hypothetical protein Cgig2_021956 [Carnegiea gigantea]